MARPTENNAVVQTQTMAPGDGEPFQDNASDAGSTLVADVCSLAESLSRKYSQRNS